MFWTRTKDVFTMSGEHIAECCGFLVGNRAEGFCFGARAKRNGKGVKKKEARHT